MRKALRKIKNLCNHFFQIGVIDEAYFFFGAGFFVVFVVLGCFVPQAIGLPPLPVH
jgi:hypothetical protein